jgi:hypothetical protein
VIANQMKRQGRRLEASDALCHSPDCEKVIFQPMAELLVAVQLQNVEVEGSMKNCFRSRKFYHDRVKAHDDVVV